MKPALKALGARHLKVKYDRLLLTFAFKFNLRRFDQALYAAKQAAAALTGWGARGLAIGDPNGPPVIFPTSSVGRCRSTP
jgi:hypothetical protein